jgi:hypothetical protein
MRPAWTSEPHQQERYLPVSASINQQKAPVNAAADKEREYLLHALRVAATRSRLATNLFDTIGVSLRHKSVTTDEAMRWLADEDLLRYVDFGPAKTVGAS